MDIKLFLMKIKARYYDWRSKRCKKEEEKIDKEIKKLQKINEALDNPI